MESLGLIDVILIIFLLVSRHLLGLRLRLLVLLGPFVMINLVFLQSLFLLSFLQQCGLGLIVILFGRFLRLLAHTVSVLLLRLLVVMVLFVRVMLFDFLLDWVLIFLVILLLLDLRDLRDGDLIARLFSSRRTTSQLRDLEHLRVHVVAHLTHHERRHVELPTFLF